jgi:hypothetical protein
MRTRLPRHVLLPSLALTVLVNVAIRLFSATGCSHRIGAGVDDRRHRAAPPPGTPEGQHGEPPLVSRGKPRGVLHWLTDEQAAALDHARNSLAVRATSLRGIEQDYRARLLDEPAQLVASAAEQAERSAEVIAHMLNQMNADPRRDRADADWLSPDAAPDSSGSAGGAL